MQHLQPPHRISRIPDKRIRAVSLFEFGVGNDNPAIKLVATDPITRRSRFVYSVDTRINIWAATL
jgi:hypothetical protein